MGDEAVEKTEQAGLSDVNADNLIEDVFGLNVRGLKTLGVYLLRPAKIYAAARAPDWLGKYTPSFRLWFSLVAFIFFFQFFWAGNSSATLSLIETQLRDGGVLPDGVDAALVAREFAKWSFGLIPFAMIICFSLAALVFPFWGRGVNAVVKFRQVFVTIIPGTVVTIPLTIATGFVTGPQLWWVITATYMIVIVCDGTTAFRGAFPTKTVGGRIWRAIALALLISATAALAGLIANTLAGVVMTMKYS